MQQSDRSVVTPPLATDAHAAPVFQVSALEKTFGSNKVLKGVDLEVGAGEVVTVIGRSGGGKSTLLRCLNLLEHPTGGTITVQEQVIADDHWRLRGRALVEFRRKVGMVFQSFNLFPHLTAVENVSVPLIHGLRTPESEAARIAVEMLDRVGMREKALELPERLSGGQQQRVAIARALASRPVALLFDEPTSALDPESSQEVLRVMKQLSSEGMTMVVVTHELSFAASVSDTVAFIDEGLIVEIGAPESVIKNPQQKRTQEFLEPFEAAPTDG